MQFAYFCMVGVLLLMIFKIIDRFSEEIATLIAYGLVFLFFLMLGCGLYWIGTPH
jgi:hypothetical protein